MARKPVLHTVDDMISPSVEVMIAATDPPESDAGLVALARVLASSIDRMSNEERARMLGQTVPPLLKVLVELDRHAFRRAEAPVPAGPTRLDALRESYARRHAPRPGAL